MPDARNRILEFMTEAESFAREAGEVTLRWFGASVHSESKEDGTPVTIADREAEKLLRQRIEDRFPGHGILGEEFGETGEGADVRWILDPIDGTKSFIHGVPLYGVLIGIELEGEPVVGVAHFPALRETVVAGVGFGARHNGNPCAVSATPKLSDALLLTTDATAAATGRLGEGWRALGRRVGLSRTWGDAYGHMLVATGRADIMVDPELSPWDAAPLLTIVSEAGGRFTSTEGHATIHGGSGISSNGILHSEVIDRLSASLRQGAAD
ncbi:MAG TPA: histidinol-phosphatase [Longimicrobiales bacterium]|nr:histidinol-phosphatase [Longimicrobiales bacterium]